MYWCKKCASSFYDDQIEELGDAYTEQYEGHGINCVEHIDVDDVLCPSCGEAKVVSADDLSKKEIEELKQEGVSCGE